MSKELSLSNEHQAENLEEEIYTAIKGFQTIKSRPLKLLLDYLPPGIVTVILVEVLITQRFFASDLMTVSGLAAACVAALLLRALFDKVPGTLMTLWDRKVIRYEQGDVGLREKYCDFIKGFEDTLNHRASWISGLFFASLMYLSFPFRLRARLASRGYIVNVVNWIWLVARHGPWYDLLGIFLEILLGYVLGLFAWRMIVIAWEIRSLGQDFDLHVQVEHPDKSGGLRPLGDLCFSNALVIMVPGFWLAAWIVVISYLDLTAYAIWPSYFKRLLVVIFFLALVAFFQPLNSIHKAMVKKRVEIQKRLDELSRKMDELAKSLLESADSLEPQEGQKKLDELKFMRQIYENNSKIPVWPFDRSVFIKFVTSQAVPLLSLTGVWPSVLRALESLLAFIQQYQR